MKRKLMIVPLLALALTMTACGPNTIALLDAIVSAAEVAIPLIPNISPADQTAIINYLNSTLTITDGLITCGTSAACIGQAISQFNNLVVPQLSGTIPAAAIAAIRAVAAAIGAFLKAYTPAPSPTTFVPARLTITQQGQLNGLHTRIVAAKAKLRH